jgi:hypothetical protein
MKLIDIYLENVQDVTLDEGERWDKTKAFVKKHKGKIAAGVAGAAAIGAAAYGGKKYKDNKDRQALQKRGNDSSDAMKASVDAGEKVDKAYRNSPEAKLKRNAKKWKDIRQKAKSGAKNLIGKDNASWIGDKWGKTKKTMGWK